MRTGLFLQAGGSKSEIFVFDPTDDYFVSLCAVRFAVELD